MQLYRLTQKGLDIQLINDIANQEMMKSTEWARVNAKLKPEMRKAMIFHPDYEDEIIINEVALAMLKGKVSGKVEPINSMPDVQGTRFDKVFWMSGI